MRQYPALGFEYDMMTNPVYAVCLNPCFAIFVGDSHQTTARRI